MCLFFFGPFSECVMLLALSHTLYSLSLQVSLPILFHSQRSAEQDDSSYAVKDVNCSLCSSQHLVLFQSPSLPQLSLTPSHPPPSPLSPSVHEAPIHSSAASYADVDGQEE